jgi:hypothetical protein
LVLMSVLNSSCYMIVEYEYWTGTLRFYAFIYWI